MSDLPSWAFGGNRVTCINDEPENGMKLGVVKGRDYTIAEIRQNTWIGGDHVTLKLVELDPPNEFWIKRFEPSRPVVSRLDRLARRLNRDWASSNGP